MCVVLVGQPLLDDALSVVKMKQGPCPFVEISPSSGISRIRLEA